MNSPTIIRSCVLAGAAILLMSLCSPVFERGDWNNIDPNTDSITRVEVDWFCQDISLNGVPCCPVGHNFHIQLWGACSPVDCDWGRLEARHIGGGYKFAYRENSLAKRYIYFKQSSYLANALYVQIYTDFYNPSKVDYVSHDWFRM